ncbi:MAG: O-antigen ligase family protein [Alphaproteobacteria bacterium]|nr:O-antigen ligase family protein [Alphaproteobacteria bacterium]
MRRKHPLRRPLQIVLVGPSGRSNCVIDEISMLRTKAVRLNDRSNMNEVGWPLPVAIVVAMLFGGASRADVLPLLFLRPLAALLFVYAIFFHGRAAFQRSPMLMVFAFCTLALVALHVVPLPPGVWSGLPGRQIAVDVYRVAGLPLPWLPLSMSPAGAWNALFSLFLPLGVLVLALAATGGEQVRAMRLFLILGLISGFIGLLQILGSQQGALYFYDITNRGSAVGLFANRNHQAVLLASLFPLLAMHVSLIDNSQGRLQLHWIVSIAAAAFIAPLILVTGSRNGLLLGVAGLVLAFWVFDRKVSRSAPKESARLARYAPWAVIGGLLLLSLTTVLLSRGQAFQRLVNLDASQDLRFKALPTIWEITRDVFPWGSGFGSFDDVFRIYEPTALLSPNYLNRAHNDWLELAMTGGLPTLLLALWGGVMFLLALRRLIRPRNRGRGERSALIAARCAAVILLLLAMGSVAEYPARTPSLAVLGVLCATVLARIFKGSVGAPPSRQTHAGSGEPISEI